MAALLHLLFPARCPACDVIVLREEEARGFCEACALEVEPFEEAGCAICGERAADGRTLCVRCHTSPPPFARASAAFVHGGAVAKALHAFKYRDRPELAAPLAALVVARCQRFLKDAPDAVCALPLHRSRLHERRYDQAQLLARELASRTERRFLAAALERTRSTAPQVALGGAERADNVAGAFQGGEGLEGARVLLVDDVFTTGATARAAVAALREAGVREAWVLTVARAAAD